MKIKPYSQPTTRYWITADGQYYTGDRMYPGDSEVTARPDGTYDEWDGSQWVQNQELKSEADAAASIAAARMQDIVDNLPSWAEIDAAITSATTITAIKVIVRKMARVVYWLAKNRVE